MPTILITGTSRGIGRRLAELYVSAGWAVLAASRGGPAVWGTECISMDVADRNSVQHASACLSGRPIDVVLNNAGIFGDRGSNLGQLNEAVGRKC